MQKFRFHVVGLPHTEITKEFVTCAYTQKVLNFSKMMMSLGHEVYLYGGGDKTEAPCTEFISCISAKEQKAFFGGTDVSKKFYPIVWDENLLYWQTMNNNAVREINVRRKEKDFLCLIGGTCQVPIAKAVPLISVEFGVGYIGIFAQHRVFESYAWMHHCYGLNKIENGLNFDAVIPNYWDSSEFPFSEEQDDYYLYIGRLTGRKGCHIAAEAVGKMGGKIKIAGQGVIEYIPGKKLVTEEFTLEGDHFEYLGTVDVKKRGELMSKAKAVFVPTQYIEPFGGTHIEAMLCGTPVITSDWGVFTETVTNGFNGYRTRSMGEIEWAMKAVARLDRKAIRKWAIDNFDLERVKIQYQAFFEQVYTRWDKGYYSDWNNGIANLNRYSDYRPKP